jgi:hypothetical protein
MLRNSIHTKSLEFVKLRTYEEYFEDPFKEYIN